MLTMRFKMGPAIGVPEAAAVAAGVGVIVSYTRAKQRNGSELRSNKALSPHGVGDIPPIPPIDIPPLALLSPHTPSSLSSEVLDISGVGGAFLVAAVRINSSRMTCGLSSLAPLCILAVHVPDVLYVLFVL
jgi:hypothetical protein